MAEFIDNECECSTPTTSINDDTPTTSSSYEPSFINDDSTSGEWSSVKSSPKCKRKRGATSSSSLSPLSVKKFKGAKVRKPL